MTYGYMERSSTKYAEILTDFAQFLHFNRMKYRYVNYVQYSA